MKNKFLTSPFLVLYSLFAPSPILLPLFIFACIDNLPNNITSPIIVLLLHLVMNLILVCIFNRAFILINFSDAGARTQYLDLKWEDIKYVNITNFELFKYSLIPTKNLKFIVISKNEVNSSFNSYNPKQCILLPYNNKTLKKLSAFSNKRSIAINNFIEHKIYHDLL